MHKLATITGFFIIITSHTTSSSNAEEKNAWKKAGYYNPNDLSFEPSSYMAREDMYKDFQRKEEEIQQTPLDRWLEQARFFSDGAQNRDGYGGGGGGGGGYGGGCYCKSDDSNGLALALGLASIAAGLVLAAVLQAQAAAAAAAAAAGRRKRSLDDEQSDDLKQSWAEMLYDSFAKYDSGSEGSEE